MLISLNKVAIHLCDNPEALTEDEVNKITDYINAASTFIESYCDISFTVQEFEQIYRANGQRIIALKHSPLIEVLESDLDYYNTSPVAVYLNEKAPTGGMRKIKYTYGYERVPFDVEQACLELVLWKYKLHTHIDVKSTTIDKATVEYNVSYVPAFTLAILDKYRKKFSI